MASYPQSEYAQTSSAPPSKPTIAFTITEARQTERWPSRIVDGDWHPPIDYGANSYARSETWGKFYIYDFDTLLVTRELNRSFTEYSTCTVYTDGSGNIWSVPVDATIQRIGPDPETEDADEVEDPTSASEQKLDWVSWRSLTFEHPASRSMDPSILVHGGDKDRLHVQRPDQTWVRKLFSSRFHSMNTSNTVGRGGLVGEVGLIIALIALFASPEGQGVEQALVECIGHQTWPWRAPSGTVRGRVLGRGVVVTIYIVPGWEDHMESLERGGYGKFFG